MTVNFTLRIRTELLDRMKKYAEENYLSVSDVIRQALIKYIKDKKEEE